MPSSENCLSRYRRLAANASGAPRVQLYAHKGGALQDPVYQAVRLNVEIKVDLQDPDDPAYWDPETVADRLLLQLDETGMMARTEIQCFEWTVLQYIRELRPDATLAFLSDGGYDVWLNWYNRTYKPKVPVNIDNYAEELTARIREICGDCAQGGICIWEPYWGFFTDAYDNSVPALTRPMVELAHERGLPVVPWTLYDYDTVPAAYNPYQPQLSRSTAYLLSLEVDGFLTNRPDIARGILLAQGVGAPPSVG